jgi:SM-20-related protein
MSPSLSPSPSPLLNYPALEQATVHKMPYPFFVVDQSINSDLLEPVLNDFPTINNGGSFTLDNLQPGPAFDQLIQELNGAEFRDSISKKLQVDLKDLPMVVTLRGMSRAKDGRVHTDSKSKVATILIYFNNNWTSDTGKLRILNSNDMEDMFTEVEPNAGSLLAFKVTDNGWHGYPAFVGQRRSIQINYVTDQKAVAKHHGRHGWTAKLKTLKNLFS